MGKKEDHERELEPLIDEYARSGQADRLEACLLSGSNLPGPRGNLELAAAFGDAIQARAVEGSGVPELWDLCTAMAHIPAAEAPINDPREFLPFCGAVGLGAIASVHAASLEAALANLRSLAGDPRWRMREGVVFGLQRLLAAHPRETLAALENWIAGGDPLQMRAAAATVAEPALLQERETALVALQLHRDVFYHLPGLGDRRSDPFRTLRKGLGYTLSVVVSALPTEGFAFMAELAASDDPDVCWIVRQNLKKNRLVKGFPGEVAAVEALLA